MKIHTKLAVMMDIRAKYLNMHLVGRVLGEIDHIAVKLNFMINTDKIQAIVKTNQITLINNINLIQIIVKVEEISISIGMKKTQPRATMKKLKDKIIWLLKYRKL